jgi:hypothetical protein
LGKTIRLLPTTDGELRAADGEQPAADRYEPAELNRIGFRLYEKFRPDVPYGQNARYARF